MATQITDIHHLAQGIRRIEERGGCGDEMAPPVCIPTGWADVDRTLATGEQGGLGCHMVHEWFSDPVAAASLDHPPTCIFQHLVRQACGPEPPDPSKPRQGRRWSLWIGRGCWPYPWALAGRDLEQTAGAVSGATSTGSLLSQTVLIDPPDTAGRLWAIDLAVRSGAVGAVVADGRGLDMAATRRLQLAVRGVQRAGAGRTLVLLARPMSEIKRLSAAATRWLVQSAPSPDEQPQWRVQLLRCKAAAGRVSAGRVGDLANFWHLRWDDAKGTVHLDADVGDRPRASDRVAFDPVAQRSA